MISNTWKQISEKNQSFYNNKKPVKISDLCGFYGKENYTKEFKFIRLFGPIKSRAMHCVEGRTVDSKGVAKKFIYYVDCANYNDETGGFDDHDCPYCKYGFPLQVKFYQNAIIRELEENAPDNRGQRTEFEKTPQTIEGVKYFVKEDPDVKKGAWTPVRIVEIPKALATKLGNMEESNFIKDPETGKRISMPVTDLQYGIDLCIKYDPDAAANAKYALEKDMDSGRTPITKEIRREYLIWDLKFPKPKIEDIKADFKRSAEKLVGAKNEEEFEAYKVALQAEKLNRATEKVAEARINSVTLSDDDMMDDLDDTPVQQVMKEMELSGEPENNQDSDDEFEDLD